MYQRNAKVTQHDPDFENANVGDDEEHLEALHRPILTVNVAKINTCIHQRKNVLEGHTKSCPCTLFSPFDSNYPKQQIIFNHCDIVYLKTIERGQELYTDPRGININRMIFIGQLMWIVTPGKE